MDWIPLSFLAFKLVVFGTCMFFAIKWHYDKARKKKEAGGSPASTGGAHDASA